MKKWLKKAIPFIMSASVLAGMITLVNVFATIEFQKGETQCPTCESADNIDVVSEKQIDCFLLLQWM